MWQAWHSHVDQSIGWGKGKMGKEISSYEVRTPVIKLVGDGSRKRGFKLRNTGGMIVEFTMFIENTESTVKRAGNGEGEAIVFRRTSTLSHHLRRTCLWSSLHLNIAHSSPVTLTSLKLFLSFKSLMVVTIWSYLTKHWALDTEEKGKKEKNGLKDGPWDQWHWRCNCTVITEAWKNQHHRMRQMYSVISTGILYI